MKKIKFQIKGMHCVSCAKLIESGVKEIPGVLESKVNFESKRGVAVYDEEKTSDAAILAAAGQGNEYAVQKENEQDDEILTRPSKKPSNSSSMAGRESDLVRNFFIVLSIASLMLNVYFIGKNSKADANINAAAVIPYKSASPSPVAAQVQSFNIVSTDHVRGNFDAPVTLVEFSDFECPFCQKQYQTLKKLMAEYPKKIRLVYKHFPLSIHANSQKAAEAAEAANEQGKFWEYHDKLFENQSNFSTDNFKKWAKEIGLNSERFNSVLDSGKYAQKVKDDFQEGISKEVQGTPATFINGQLISGALSYDTFKQIIDRL